MISQGVHLFDLTVPACGENEEYYMEGNNKCGSDCLESCQNLTMNVRCPEECNVGCYCKEGYYRLNGVCVTEETCLCKCIRIMSTVVTWSCNSLVYLGKYDTAVCSGKIVEQNLSSCKEDIITGIGLKFNRAVLCNTHCRPILPIALFCHLNLIPVHMVRPRQAR